MLESLTRRLLQRAVREETKDTARYLYVDNYDPTISTVYYSEGDKNYKRTYSAERGLITLEDDEEEVVRTEVYKPLVSLTERGQDLLVQLAERKFPPKVREKLAEKGAALPDGSFPIPDKDGLRRAVKSIGRAKPDKKAAVKALVKKRAAALGAKDKVPSKW